MLRKVLVALTLIPVLSGCQGPVVSSSESLDYEDFTARTISIAGIFDVNLPKCDVYLFSRYCDACRALKESVFDYALDHEDFYFVDLDKEKVYDVMRNGQGLTDEQIQTKNLGVASAQELYFRHSPCLIEIKEGQTVLYLDNYQNLKSWMEGKYHEA